MFVIWQGYGYVALAVAILPLAACVGLIDFSQKIAFLAAGLAFLLGGIVCLVVSRRLQRPSGPRDREDWVPPESSEPVTPHTLYFVPLAGWGWLYVAAGIFLAGTSAVGIILKGWKQ